MCLKSVRSNQCSVACDSCDQWFHKRCMCMKTVVFENLRNVSCRVPNFTDSFFADLVIDHQNTFAYLSDSSNSLSSMKSSSELAGPTAMSSPISREQIHYQMPKHLKLLNINTQSIKNETTDLLSIIPQSQPDIIVATETWLKPTVMSSETLCRMEQYVDLPTRQDNILDLFFTNRASLVEKLEIQPGISDHDIVYIESAQQPAKIKPIKRKICLWKMRDIDQLKASAMMMVKRFCSRFTSASSVEVVGNCLKDHLIQIQEDCIPSK